MPGKRRSRQQHPATPFTYVGNVIRGIGVGLNGDVLLAPYNGSVIHRISPFTGIMSVMTGTGTAGYIDGPRLTGQVNAARGVTEDAFGNVYIADTASAPQPPPSVSSTSATGQFRRSSSRQRPASP